MALREASSPSWVKVHLQKPNSLNLFFTAFLLVILISTFIVQLIFNDRYHNKLAHVIVGGARNSVLLGDFRNTILSLNSTSVQDFVSVAYYNSRGQRVFAIPISVDAVNVGNSKSFSPISQSKIIIPILFEEGSASHRVGEMIFSFDRFEFFKYWMFSAVLILIIGNIVLQKINRKNIAAEEAKRINAIANEKMLLAQQVSHDIRSPLAALNMVIGTLGGIPEDKRILIRNAAQRINDISNDLLETSKKTGSYSSQETQETRVPQLTNEFIPALVDTLVSEKRMQFREHIGIEIEIDLKNSFGAFAMVNREEIKRIISNLINNSVEAFENFNGRIGVCVCKFTENEKAFVAISVVDNGKGIPDLVLQRIGQYGNTHGKEGGQSGTGLGIFHAKKAIENLGGQFCIKSREGNGTTVTIVLPASDVPAWCNRGIDLSNIKTLVSLDDDNSIHHLWQERINSLGIGFVGHVKFQSGDAFDKFVRLEKDKIETCLFLIDYELLNQPRNGLELINDLDIASQSVLVTSRYEEAHIQKQALISGVKILPKSLSGVVPFKIKTVDYFYDWVLLDDDELVHLMWKFAADEGNKKFLGFRNPKELFDGLQHFSLEQKIYIDSQLADGRRGEDIARELHDGGFKNIYLATGNSPELYTDLTFLRGVVGKQPPIQ